MSSVRGQVIAAGIKIQLVAVKQVRVDQGGQQIMRGGDRMKVAVEVQVDLARRVRPASVLHPAAPPFIPNTGPREGSREQTNRAFADRSPALAQARWRSRFCLLQHTVGVVAVTRISLPPRLNRPSFEQLEAQLGANRTALLVKFRRVNSAWRQWSQSVADSSASNILVSHLSSCMTGLSITASGADVHDRPGQSATQQRRSSVLFM